jgi:hypothetical protein
MAHKTRAGKNIFCPGFILMGKEKISYGLILCNRKFLKVLFLARHLVLSSTTAVKESGYR